MLGQYLITFREVLEAALIASIVIAYFVKTRKTHLTRFVWTGIALAVAASAVFAIAVTIVYGGLSDADATLFEGLAALIAVAVLTSMIVWMALKAKDIRKELEERTSHAVGKGTALGLVGFSFIVVFREGFETVLFLIPFGAEDGSGTVAGALLGIASALMIAFLIFKLGLKLNLGKFFYFTSILLVLLAAGLLGYGVHELISYQKDMGADPGLWGQYAFDLGIASDSIFYHKGAVGSVFAVMFGYSVKMEWARILVHAAYLLVFIPLTMTAYRRPEKLDFLRRMTIWSRHYSPFKEQVKQVIKRDMRYSK